jgi:hypothetical protein
VSISNSEHWKCVLPVLPPGQSWDNYYGDVDLERFSDRDGPLSSIKLPFSGLGISSLGVGADPALLVDTKFAKSKTLAPDYSYPNISPSVTSGQRTWLDLVSDPARTFNLEGFDNPSTTSGWKSGDGILFNGTTDYVRTTGFYQHAVTAYTVEAWVYISSSATDSDRVIFGNRGAADSNSLTLYSSAHLFMFAADRAGFRMGIKTNVQAEIGKVHHVVGTWAAPSGTSVDSSHFQIYLNGKKVVTTPQSLTGYSFISPLSGDPAGAMIGSNGSTDPKFMGQMRRVAVYNRVLSDNEIYEHCAGFAFLLPTYLIPSTGCSR